MESWPLTPPPHLSQKIKDEKRIAYVLGQFPSLSETFIRRELAGLSDAGMDVNIYADAPGDVDPRDENVRYWMDKTEYITPIVLKKLFASFLALLFIRPIRSVGLFFYLLFNNYEHDKSLRKDLKYFIKGVYLAKILLKEKVHHLHAPWTDRRAFLSLLLNRLIGVSYSVQVRAYELYRQPLHYKLKDILVNAKFIITNSTYNQAEIVRYLPPEQIDKIHVIYNRIDLNKFSPGKKPGDGGRIPLLLSVGRLVEKKGHIYLLKACQILMNKGVEFRCQIIGGPDINRDTTTFQQLKAGIDEFGLQQVISLEGAKPYPEVEKAYQAADIFVLPSVIDRVGDRDITPNVLLEAMSLEIPVVSTRIGGIPEIVDHDKNGLLVAPGDTDALADAILSLMNDPKKRAEFGKAGKRKIAQQFDIIRNTEQLIGLFKSL
jgi:glycosyltransferase involved in cell wall biosynthesis